ncbi:hypothetical protein [Chryseobacterium angstadtii]|nr:hypothetical protein [Chryseobacterium angstadtii]
MKRNTIYTAIYTAILLVALPALVKVKGQVGINTTNPRGTLHIDGGKNNSLTGAPTDVQSTDDFIVLPTGSVGIGTASPKGKLDLNTTQSGFVFPRLTTSERDNNISPGFRPASTMIYNTTLDRLQYNSGTDAVPFWSTLESPPDTFNTTVRYTKDRTILQDISTAGVNITYQLVTFNNIPNGYITKTNNDIINLAQGKTYRIIANMGRMGQVSVPDSDFYASCSLMKIENSNSQVVSKVDILPPNSTRPDAMYWSDNNVMVNYITTTSFPVQIYVKCNRIGGSDTRPPVQLPVNNGIPPYIEFTILN